MEIVNDFALWNYPTKIYWVFLVFK